MFCFLFFVQTPNYFSNLFLFSLSLSLLVLFAQLSFCNCINRYYYRCFGWSAFIGYRWCCFCCRIFWWAVSRNRQCYASLNPYMGQVAARMRLHPRLFYKVSMKGQGKKRKMEISNEMHRSKWRYWMSCGTFLVGMWTNWNMWQLNRYFSKFWIYLCSRSRRSSGWVDEKYRFLFQIFRNNQQKLDWKLDDQWRF